MVILLFALLLAATQADVGLQQPLELKAYLDAPVPWFPTQEGKILYQIRYQGKIQLTDEQLPMLDPKQGFEKVGDKVIEDYKELNYNVQNISQKIRPSQSGHFIFPPSHVEGFLYEIRGGNIIPTGTVKSDLPAYELDVAPFPKEGQPPDFNGTVGSYTFSLERVGQGPTQIGDWMTLAWTVTGTDHNGLRLPNIACLPGIVGFFRLNDLPVEITETNNKRTYTFQIAPLIQGISQIPPLSWSVYDPQKGSYSTWKSKPIPLTEKTLAKSPPTAHPNVPLTPLAVMNEKANELLQKGEIPLSLLVLQREWRNKPWSQQIPESIHSIEERAGLPLSDFPIYPFLLSLFRWFLLPFTLYALWKKSTPLLLVVAFLSLFLLWERETDAIVLNSTLPNTEATTPFLAGETVRVHSQEGDAVLISSKRQIGLIPRRALIDI